jgi:hypothetical protein
MSKIPKSLGMTIDNIKNNICVVKRQKLASYFILGVSSGRVRKITSLSQNLNLGCYWEYWNREGTGCTVRKNSDDFVIDNNGVER